MEIFITDLTSSSVLKDTIKCCNKLLIRYLQFINLVGIELSRFGICSIVNFTSFFTNANIYSIENSRVHVQIDQLPV